jgi:hypothetical protein
MIDLELWQRRCCSQPCFRELGPPENVSQGEECFDEQDVEAHACEHHHSGSGSTVGGFWRMGAGPRVGRPDGWRGYFLHGFGRPRGASNNLHIDVHLPSGESGRFNLTELTFAWCSDDPAIANPTAPFDTYQGAGMGTFNGEGGYCADWQFIDVGERDGSDIVNLMRVWLPSTPGNCAFEAGGFIFSVPLGAGHEVIGNHQALKSN